MALNFFKPVMEIDELQICFMAANYNEGWRQGFC